MVLGYWPGTVWKFFWILFAKTFRQLMFHCNCLKHSFYTMLLKACLSKAVDIFLSWSIVNTTSSSTLEHLEASKWRTTLTQEAITKSSWIVLIGAPSKLILGQQVVYPEEIINNQPKTWNHHQSLIVIDFCISKSLFTLEYYISVFYWMLCTK